MTTVVQNRQLRDLSGIGPSIEADLHLLGIHRVEQLVNCEGKMLYEELCRLTNAKQDVCVLDVMNCVVAQARYPDLPVEQRNWWWWSRRRKQCRP